jgi:hypothetical protein
LRKAFVNATGLFSTTHTLLSSYCDEAGPSKLHYQSTDLFTNILRLKIKVMFGHKLRYGIKVMFGEISLKLCQTNWNVARINVNGVAGELSNQISVDICLTIDIWTRWCQRTSMKLVPKVFDLDTPGLLDNA